MNLASAIAKVTAPLKRRVLLMVGRAIVTLVNDSTGIQSMQLSGLAGELLGDVERFQEYGFTSVPIPGAEAAVVFVGGNREHGLIIGVDDRKYRLKGLAGGDVAIYDMLGQAVLLKPAEGKIVVQSANVELGVGVLEKLLNGETFQTFFNSHVHIGNLGAPTGAPTAPSTALHLSSQVKGAM